jgi:hypothetical protein
MERTETLVLNRALVLVLMLPLLVLLLSLLVLVLLLLVLLVLLPLLVLVLVLCSMLKSDLKNHNGTTSPHLNATGSESANAKRPLTFAASPPPALAMAAATSGSEWTDNGTLYPPAEPLTHVLGSDTQSAPMAAKPEAYIGLD